jgi:hypothetical protein
LRHAEAISNFAGSKMSGPLQNQVFMRSARPAAGDPLTPGKTGEENAKQCRAMAWNGRQCLAAGWRPLYQYQAMA